MFGRRNSRNLIQNMFEQLFFWGSLMNTRYQSISSVSFAHASRNTFPQTFLSGSCTASRTMGWKYAEITIRRCFLLIILQKGFKKWRSGRFRARVIGFKEWSLRESLIICYLPDPISLWKRRGSSSACKSRDKQKLSGTWICSFVTGLNWGAHGAFSQVYWLFRADAVLF